MPVIGLGGVTIESRSRARCAAASVAETVGGAEEVVGADELRPRNWLCATGAGTLPLWTAAALNVDTPGSEGAPPSAGAADGGA